MGEKQMDVSMSWFGASREHCPAGIGYPDSP
jgi:hypothetical protein